MESNHGCISPPVITDDDEMNITSPNSNSNKSGEPCLVCGIPTNKIHFQVNSCRACAAFFRRSIKLKSPYRCQRSIGSCDVTLKTIGKPLCRYCRLKKCTQIGMKINKNEKFSSNFIFGENETEIKPTVIKREPSVIMYTPKMSVNVMKIFQAVTVIFEQKTILFPKSSTTKIVDGFGELLLDLLESTKPNKPLTQLEDFNNPERVIFFENFLIKVAQLLSQFEYFTALHSTEKLLLYKRFWQIFFVLERCYHSTEHFGTDPDDTRILADRQHFVEISSAKFKVPSNQRQSDANVFLLPYINNILFLLKPLKKTNLTLFEFSYICQIILWSCYEIIELSDSTQKFADEMIIKVSNELHDYYTKKMRMSNYAGRQAQLFKLIQISEYIYRDKKQMMAANEIFNFIENDFHFSALS
jgi:nuclear factor 4